MNETSINDTISHSNVPLNTHNSVVSSEYTYGLKDVLGISHLTSGGNPGENLDADIGSWDFEPENYKITLGNNTPCRDVSYRCNGIGSNIQGFKIDKVSGVVQYPDEGSPPGLAGECLFNQDAFSLLRENSIFQSKVPSSHDIDALINAQSGESYKEKYDNFRQKYIVPRRNTGFFYPGIGKTVTIPGGLKNEETIVIADDIFVFYLNDGDTICYLDKNADGPEYVNVYFADGGMNDMYFPVCLFDDETLNKVEKYREASIFQQASNLPEEWL